MRYITCRVPGCWNYLVALQMDLTDYDIDTMQPTGKLVPVVCICGTFVDDVADEAAADAIDAATFTDRVAAGTWEPGVGPVENG